MSKKSCNSAVQGNTADTMAANVEVQRQAALLKTGALQNAILKSAYFSSIATDETGVIQIFNVGAERMLGYAAVDVVNKITPADISDPQEVIARAKALSLELATPITPGFEALVFKASRGIEDIYELTYIRKNGSRFPAIVSVTALRDAQGAILGYLLIGTDNTARKQAEEEEERNRFFRLSQDMLCTAGFDGYFKDLSPSWEKTLGYTKEELLAKPYLEFIHPEDRERTLAEAQKNSDGQTTFTFENRYHCKDGSYRWFLWTATPVLEERLIYAGARDITERKRIEEQAAENLKTLTDFKAALDEHAIVATTNPRGKITYVNDKFCAIAKYSREELMGQDHRTINSGHHPKAFIRELWQTITSGRVWKGEIKNRAKDGSFYWVATTIVPFLGADGKPTQYIAIRADITERKQAEAELKLSKEQLETANKELEAFSYSVSHDLRAPLRHINGFSRVLQEEAAAALDEESRLSLDMIVKASKQMGQLIDDLLVFSRMGRAEVRKEVVNLGQVVKEVLQDSLLDTQGRDIRWTVGALPEVEGDPAMLRQVLANLIGNAVKYTGTRQHATIEIGCVNGAHDTRDETAIYVRDNGVGFNMKYAHKLFGVFQRLHRAEEFEGTGIGLANVKRIIHRHGGRVWAEGSDGVGATFYFSLPHREEGVLA